ncbi:Ig heavy chain Mem5-like [Athene noctua]|uniref:Ig heavy chain Mem5-like n=1 Tax=Athene noctua TaxID=126797 RepID=UPI003EC0227C
MMAPGLGPWLLALALAAGPAGLWAQMSLLEAGGGLRAPGDSVLLSCRGSGFTFWSYYILWYRQTPDGRLEWVSFISSSSGTAKKYGAAVQGRATVSRDNSRSESSLLLRSLGPRDSARYFCAVRWWRLASAVWTDKLIFGSGTTLTVEPSNQNNSVPEVIVIKSKKWKENDNTGKAACLARNFYTKNISLEMSSSEVVYEQSTSIFTSEKLYNTFKVVSVTKDTDVTCTAKFNGKAITAKATSPEKVGDPVAGKTCNTTDTSAQDTKMEKTNMLSMTVLGLRVLLAKSIAFNTLMSVKLFLF